MKVKNNLRAESMASDQNLYEENKIEVLYSDDEEEKENLEDVFYDAIGEIQMGSARLNESMRMNKEKDYDTFKSLIDYDAIKEDIEGE